jgi:threonine dehydratase
VLDLEDRLARVDVEAAAARIAGVAHRTPVFTSRTLDDRLGARVFFKAENLQRAGAFKFRGAYNRVAQLSAQELAGGVVAASSGNHAQALALAAALRGSAATILMPYDAPASKRAATEAYGATVLSYDRGHDDREALAAQLAQERGLTMVPPYDDPDIVSGAGTTALELFEAVGELDLLLVCAGGGGLLAGCAAVAAERHPGTRVIAVEPEASEDWRLSLAAGHRVRVTVGDTIADGQMLATPGELNFAIAHAAGVEGVTVSDEQVCTAMRFLFERLKLVVEPSGATAFAALLAGAIDVRGARVGVTLSGGNVAADRFAALLGR